MAQWPSPKDATDRNSLATVIDPTFMTNVTALGYPRLQFMIHDCVRVINFLLIIMYTITLCISIAIRRQSGLNAFRPFVVHCAV